MLKSNSSSIWIRMYFSDCLENCAIIPLKFGNIRTLCRHLRDTKKYEASILSTKESNSYLLFSII